MLAGIDGVLVPGGFGERGFEGKIRDDPLGAENGVPFLRHLLRHAGGGRRVRAPRAHIPDATTSEFAVEAATR
jgi:CTP synthase